MAARTTNEKDPRVTSTGPLENHTTNEDDFTGNPAQIELTFQFQTEKQVPEVRKYSRKSTSTEAQHQRIDAMLTTGEKNTFQFRKAGIMSPASRIKEMNDRLGYYIPTIGLRDIHDEMGFLHKRVGVYELIDRPKNGGQHHV